MENAYGEVAIEHSQAELVREKLDVALSGMREQAEAEAVRQRRRLAKMNEEREKLLHAYYAGAVPVDLLRTEQDRIASEARQAAARSRGVGGCSAVAKGLLDGDRPDEAGELPRAGDYDLLVGLAASRHSPPTAVKTLLGAPGALDHRRVSPSLSPGQLIADPGLEPGVPGGLDQEAANVGVADLGDRTPRTLLPRGMLAWHQSDEAHEPLGPLKRWKSPISTARPRALR
ncbi:MAG: hypothetical protein ACREMY_07115, partial [bacterium]